MWTALLRIQYCPTIWSILHFENICFLKYGHEVMSFCGCYGPSLWRKKKTTFEPIIQSFSPNYSKLLVQLVGRKIHYKDKNPTKENIKNEITEISWHCLEVHERMKESARSFHLIFQSLKLQVVCFCFFFSNKKK